MEPIQNTPARRIEDQSSSRPRPSRIRRAGAAALVGGVIATGAVLTHSAATASSDMASADTSLGSKTHAMQATREQCHPDAPATITDYVEDHTNAMTRATCNPDVAVYVDENTKKLPKAQTAWVTPFVTDVWKYMKTTYGDCAVERHLATPIGPGCENFGAPKPVLVFMHDGTYGTSTVTGRFDEKSGFRSTIDVSNDRWREDDGEVRDTIVHEACHHVEGAGQGVEGSPSYAVWGDSKWAEFCVNDFYANTGRSADAARASQAFLAAHDDNLPAGAHDSHWFRDWFLPLWRDSGNNAAVMDRYFRILSQNFPTEPANDGRSRKYSRDMNTGEFVLFMSAADGRDLSDRAAAAFNSGFSRAQFEQAQKDFPNVRF